MLMFVFSDYLQTWSGDMRRYVISSVYSCTVALQQNQRRLYR